MYFDVFLWHCACYGHLCSPTIYVASGKAWLSSRSTLYMYICHVLNWIHIFHEAVMTYKGSKRRLCSSMFHAWCLIPIQFNQINVWCDSLNRPTLNQSVRFSTWLLSIRQFASSWNEYNGILKISYLSTRIYIYFVISRFWFCLKVHMARCVPTIWCKYLFVINGIHNCQRTNR